MNDTDKQPKSLEWCFKDFWRRYDGAIPFLGKVAKVGVRSARRWWGTKPHGRVPVGYQAIVLRYTLTLYGYSIDTWERLSSEIRQLGELIALDFVSLETAAKELEYSSTSTIFRLFYETLEFGDVVNDNIRKFNQHYLETYGEEIAKRREEVRSTLRLSRNNRLRASTVVLDRETQDSEDYGMLPAPKTIESTQTEVSFPIEVSVFLIKTLLPLAQKLINGDVAERVAFRRHFDKEHELHQLSDIVNALLSEHCRDKYVNINNKLERNK